MTNKKTPTAQQLHVIAQAVNEQVRQLKVEACAGGGKTSTLVMAAEALRLKSIYVAFNKVTAEEATERFPSHVTARTTHSIAFGVFGHRLMSKLNRPKGSYVNVAGTGSEIGVYFRIEGIDDVLSSAGIGAYVKQTVERFEQSADMELTMKHVPKKDMDKVLEEAPELAGVVLKYAKRLWNERIDVDSIVLASHDTYLKQYQMSKPVLPFEVVYADEFQDTSPCVLDIIMNQAATAKIIMVGDRRQAIYGWRGAVNAMQSVHCEEAPLSMSFRYGQGIADVATHILKGDMKIQGRPDLESVVGYNVVDRTQPHAFLFRTNSALLSEAVKAIDKGQKIKVEIDVKDFVKVLESAQALYDASKLFVAKDIKAALKKVKHERILPYASWAKLLEEAKNPGELKRLATIVENGEGPHIVAVLDRYVAPANASVVYTSAHKSKGREWDQVILADDFPSHYKEGEYVGLNEAEENLLYVAATRSQRVLEINPSVAEALDIAKHEYIMFGEKQSAGRASTGGMRGDMAVEAMHREMGLDDAIRGEIRTVNRIIHGDGY